MGDLLTFIGRHGTRVLFVGVFAGLLVPDFAALLRPYLAPAVVTMLLLTLARVEWQAIGLELRRPLAALAVTAGLMLGAPLAVFAILQPLGLPDPLIKAIVLMAAAPPILGATSIAILLGLDGALAVVAGLLCTILTPLTVPPLALALLGLELDIGLAAFMLRLAALIAIAFAGAFVIRRIFGVDRLRAHGTRLDALIVITMLVFVVAIMDGVTATALAEPRRVALWVLAAFVANPALQALFALFARAAGRRRALTVGLIAGNRNMGLLLAALPAGADPGVALYFAVAQLPMYMLPALQKQLYARLLARESGAKPPPR